MNNMKNKNKITLAVIIILLTLIPILVITSISFGTFLKGNYLFYTIASIFVISVSFVLFFVFQQNSKYIRTLENRLGLWNTISYRVKGAGETAFNKLPIGIVVLDDSYTIAWSNEEAKDILHSKLNGLSLIDVANGTLDEYVKSIKKEKIVTLYEKIYDIEYDEKIKVIYLKNITDYSMLQTKYDAMMSCFGYINIDNLEEATLDMDVQDKIDYNGRIISSIVEYMNKYDCFVRSLSDTKYILLCNKDALNKLMDNKFSILDDIKHIAPVNGVFVTLSIGIVCNEASQKLLSDEALSCLDLALNRGGDQVIVKLGEDVVIFGGKTDATLPTAKVDIRFKYERLEHLIRNASNVFIIGHKFQDADAFGASVAVHCLAATLNKEHYILLSDEYSDDTVKKELQDVIKFQPDLASIIKNPFTDKLDINQNSLLIVVDCQAESNLFVDEKFLNNFNNIAIIDHHRKNESGTINKPIYYFLDTTSSSTVELLMQCFEFSKLDLHISSMEATWMMLGIIVDTNNFVYRTSSATFEVASTLNKYNADMARVKEYLKEDLTEKVVRNNLIAGIEKYKGEIAIARQSDNEYLDAVTLAKVSDDLLSVQGIELAISIALTAPGVLRLSARSINRYNCQLIMEKLGGGGHFSGAACELKGYTMDEAIMLLKSAIDSEIDQSNNSLEVIYTKDIHSHKRGDIVDLTYDDGFELISSGDAVLATPENIQVFEQEKSYKEKVIANEIAILNELKERLEKYTCEVKVDITYKINYKRICKAILNKVNHALHTRFKLNQIIFNHVINKYGTYNYSIDLTNNVIANMKVFIIEK